MRGATLVLAHQATQYDISIHAPHARSDAESLSSQSSLSNFNPRSSCEERQYALGAGTLNALPFQSTLLMRGATGVPVQPTWGQRISIHAPHARSDADVALFIGHWYISIHAPHARSDETALLFREYICKFQSTLLMRGATRLR